MRTKDFKTVWVAIAFTFAILSVIMIIKYPELADVIREKINWLYKHGYLQPVLL